MEQVVAPIVGLALGEALLVRIASHHVRHRQVLIHVHAAEGVALLVEGGRAPIVPIAGGQIGARGLGGAEVLYGTVGVHAVIGEGEVVAIGRPRHGGVVRVVVVVVDRAVAVLAVVGLARVAVGTEHLTGIEHGLGALACGIGR